jgi:hypothetical protein
MEHTPILPRETRAEPISDGAALDSPFAADALSGPQMANFGHLPAVVNALAGIDRDQIAAAIELLIALLDATEPDPDIEDDDPSGQCDEDGINTGFSGLIDSDGPGCPISDPGGPTADERDGVLFPSYGIDQRRAKPQSPSVDRRLMRDHRDRIRATRCEPVRRLGMTEYRLREISDDALLSRSREGDRPG